MSASHPSPARSKICGLLATCFWLLLVALLVDITGAFAADGQTPGKQPVPPVPAVLPAPGDQSLFNQVMDNTVTTPTTVQMPNIPGDLKDLAVPQLPPELKDHNKNKTMTLGPLHMGPLIKIATLRPVRLDANYSQPVALRDCLVYALRNGLPIRINQQTYESQRYSFFGALANFLPSYSTNWTFTHTHIYPHTESDSRVYNNIMNFPVFQGGRVMYSTLGQFYRMKASRNQFTASINDTLLNAYNAYYNALLQRALLQIRVKSVEVSEVQLKLNEQLYTAGTGTRFAVMQSRTQLALDRQALLQQQVAVRLASLQMAYTINMPLAVNLIPIESTVSEASLWDEATAIDDLLSLALAHRPELRQYELLKLASARNIQVASAPLYPTAQWNIVQQHSSTTTNGGGSSSSGTGTSGAGVFGGIFNTVSMSYNMNWTLSNLGMGNVANILSARAIARQSVLQANQVLLQVSQQVRTDYLNALTAREQIDVTATGSASAAEELRLANLRVQMGVGTNLELIQAQRDYITALINQAQAIIASNQAQAQLLHDTGVISVDTLTVGFKRTIGTGGGTTQ